MNPTTELGIIVDYEMKAAAISCCYNGRVSTGRAVAFKSRTRLFHDKNKGGAWYKVDKLLVTEK